MDGNAQGLQDNARQTVQSVGSSLADQFGMGASSLKIIQRGMLRAQIEVLKSLQEAAEMQLEKLQSKPDIRERIEIE